MWVIRGVEKIRLFFVIVVERVINMEGIVMGLDIDGLDVLDEVGTVNQKEKDTGGDAEERKVIETIESAMGVQFSEEQLAVVRHTGTPLNVLSCAGSGKSTVLLAKMFYREMYSGVKPVNMLGITFNKKAQEELEERYRMVRKKLRLRRGSNPTFRTFHALFYMLLRNISGYKSYKVANEGTYMFPLIKLIHSDGNRDNKDILQEMLSYRGRLINKGISQDGIVGATFENVLFNEENYKKVIGKYNELKDENKELDFEDMQVYLLKELVENGNEEVREAFREVFHDVYIDEYQDISKIQMDILDDLIEQEDRLVTIGDDDQTINSFRGSAPEYIRDFIYRYPNAKRLFLGDNYRCKRNILEPVIASIESNKVRVDKSIRAFNEGGVIDVMPVENTYKEVAEHIKNATEGMYGEDFEDIGILVRLNSQRMLIADMLAESGVQVDIGNMYHSLRANKVYKTIMGIVKAIKEEDNRSFGEFGHTMLRSVNRDVFSKYRNDRRGNWYEDMVLDGKYGIPMYTLEYIQKIKKTNNMKNVLGYIWKMVEGYYQYLDKAGYGNIEKVLEIFRYMFQVSTGLTVTQFRKSEYIKESFLSLYCDSGNAVKINTMHSVKGLEYDTVYLIGLNNDVIPGEGRLDATRQLLGDEAAEELLEEERRLFYVAWTRAKNRLIVSYSTKNPSMFLREVKGIYLPGITPESMENPEQLNSES